MRLLESEALLSQRSKGNHFFKDIYFFDQAVVNRSISLLVGNLLPKPKLLLVSVEKTEKVNDFEVIGYKLGATFFSHNLVN